MTHGGGSLAITARRAGARTVLERVRYDGISRCSRAFADGDAARVMLSQLGPGVVRGDDVVTTGHVQAGAHLIVTNQSATRLLGGARASCARATWTLDADAVLELVGEPLVAGADARYEASTTIALASGAVALMTELAQVAAGADVRLRTSIRHGVRELFYDAIDLAACAPYAVGTFAIVGLAPQQVTPLVAALDAMVYDSSTLRLGVGALPNGAFARMIATDLWAIRSMLRALRAAAWNAR